MKTGKNKNRCQEFILFAGNHNSVISVTFSCFQGLDKAFFWGGV